MCQRTDYTPECGREIAPGLQIFVEVRESEHHIRERLMFKDRRVFYDRVEEVLVLHQEFPQEPADPEKKRS